ncbi:MAG: Ig-like domain-containing protein, partial [Pseudomonadales bacterium]|nr:Ig-like domain-containing protein [Pseudomonadales bacterium]
MHQPTLQCPSGRPFAPGARFATLLGWLLLAALPGSAFAASASDDNVDTNEDTPILISPLANDTLMVFINSVVYDGPAEGSSFSLVGAPPTQIQFIPGPDFSGEVNLRYEACGVGIPPCDTANIDIDMLEVNDLPIAVDDAASLDEDSGFIDINVTANDTDVEDDPSDLDLLGGGAAIVSGPSNGTATRENDREIRYIPDPNFSGTDSFTYAIEDQDGGVATATVTVTVIPVDDPIFAGDNSASLSEDGSITLNVLFNDSSDDGGLFVT